MPFYPFLPDLGSGFVVSIVLALAVFWVIEFIELMSLSDAQFNGQYVRFGWVAAFLMLWALAPAAFLVWNRRARGRDSAVSRLHRGRRKDAE